MENLEPPELKKGDTIAIIAPSSGLSALVPHRLENAIKYFKDKGYKVRAFPLTSKRDGWSSGTAKERAKEIMDAFLDKEVKAIICAIGGTNSNKTLKYLDFDKIKKNPKVFCGYSDITILNCAIHKMTGMITYYGPAALTQFGEFPKPLDYTIKYFNKAISGEIIGKINPSKKWTQETLNWFSKEDLKRSRILENNPGFTWLKEGTSEGKIIGGCLHSLIHLIGTCYEPEFKDKILFIETPEGHDFTKGEPVAEIDAQLCDLELANIFSKIKGLVVGRPFGYTEEEEEEFKKAILDNTREYNFPILYGVDIGHTDPQITVPLGKTVLLNSAENYFSFVD